MSKLKRKPIQLSHNSIALIQIFEGGKALEDWWVLEEHSYNNDIIKESAVQFIEQLEGHDCDMFLQELIIQCYKRLKFHDETYRKNSQWKAIDILKEKLNEIE